ncbi:hypothetical protein [Agrobacterium rubi]|uniref:Uncharacterized protein n=1 Tax=Agrobacterium rubi TaxID=28099 RepID=A0AAE7R2W9_9HYPH|nr:hypothetical protein [Agrobacterium rubi]NTE85711.1 hypothetical protein [Agrobacterium rubi]NTF01643.1 hypothetical protein [Agrobacterium rubi]NTF35886.1 hypothetical protein [Agrobacterium rubi]OCJ48230.1 hypothetical protein A6U92_08500 [Agrobacterium rubi]QTG00990.1 hypothetical protein G6M88_11570 [Agrobacterium rubi]
MENAAEWSDELDALRFSIPGHGAPCAMHRLAFKALLAEEPGREACLAFFAENKEAFLTAATAKIARLVLPFDRSLHINSRDVRRAMALNPAEGAARACRVLDQN